MILDIRTLTILAAAFLLVGVPLAVYSWVSCPQIAFGGSGAHKLPLCTGNLLLSITLTAGYLLAICGIALLVVLVRNIRS